MSAMTLQKFAVWGVDRHTHYLDDPDLKVMLNRTDEPSLRTTPEEAVVMVRVGIDEESSDLVTVCPLVGKGADLDAVDKAIAALLVVRDALTGQAVPRD